MSRVRVLVGLLVSVCVVAAPLSLPAAAAAGHRQAAVAQHKPDPVLGSKKFNAPQGHGWGKHHPKTFFNGGDPSGLVTHITWKHWGAKRSYGWGRNAIFMPGGGYYPGTVRIELRAQHLTHCDAGGPLAYGQLYAREPKRPGGKLGKWEPWASSPNGGICENT